MNQIKRLLRLAEVSQEFEHVNLHLTDLFCELREELGLAKLLIQIAQYAKSTTSKIEFNPSNPQHQNQNPDAVPRV